jgi:tryptophanyl-tRNA synthetase
MDLAHPERKMSKSTDSPQGMILVLEDPAAVAKKIKRAVTDTDGDVVYDPATRPGVSNLLSILAAATDRTPEACAKDYTQYGPLKSDTADAVVALLEPIQARYRELAADPAGTQATLAAGAAKAQGLAAPTLARAKAALGLI